MAPPVTSRTGSRETLWAIIGSFVLAVILASLVSGNPFRALGMAYFDYSHEHADANGAESAGPKPPSAALVAPK
ncbi:MAG: hypothetical protein RQ966_15180 [Acetobacteraceae bacterium]|nr:hypothetical protein [Acetobacteraceae bacterium]